MTQEVQLAAEVLRAKNIPFIVDEPLAHHTSFRIGGPAALFCTPQSVEELGTALATARAAALPVYLLGEGTNVLFCDEGYPGMVIHTAKALGGIAVQEGVLRAGAGEKLAAVCVAAQQNGLAGLGFAYGIPGSVGGAVYMNAGAYGGEMCDVLERVEYLDETGVVCTATATQLKLGYRQSVFQKKPWCVLAATFRLVQGEKDAIRAEMDDYMQRRRDKQPLELPSAGSAFKRPQGAFASALIDQSGLRGFRVGDAAVSEKHCGFIVNLGNATCADVLELARQVAVVVQARTGFVLEKEIRVIDKTCSL